MFIVTEYAALKWHRLKHENSDGYREIRTELKGKSDSCFFLLNKLFKCFYSVKNS